MTNRLSSQLVLLVALLSLVSSCYCTRTYPHAHLTSSGTRILQLYVTAAAQHATAAPRFRYSDFALQATTVPFISVDGQGNRHLLREARDPRQVGCRQTIS